jgi:hypothetical protein
LFQYISGLSGSVQTKSEAITLAGSASEMRMSSMSHSWSEEEHLQLPTVITISNISALDLQKPIIGSRDPVLLLKVLPGVQHMTRDHHRVNYRTTKKKGTLNPLWQGEASAFPYSYFQFFLLSKSNNVSVEKE